MQCPVEGPLCGHFMTEERGAPAENGACSGLIARTKSVQRDGQRGLVLKGNGKKEEE